FRHFVHARRDTEFVKVAAKIEIRSLERVVDLILAGRRNIGHPNPRLAVSFGLMMVVSALYEVVVMPAPLQNWKDLLPKDDNALKHELTRAFLSYLQVSG